MMVYSECMVRRPFVARPTHDSVDVSIFTFIMDAQRLLKSRGGGGVGEKKILIKRMWSSGECDDWIHE